jgi:hypothetical protein
MQETVLFIVTAVRNSGPTWLLLRLQKYYSQILLAYFCYAIVYSQMSIYTHNLMCVCVYIIVYLVLYF